MQKLIYNSGQFDEQEYDLGRGTTTIGRTKENDICILHKSLSRRHAQLEVIENKVFLSDQQSKNGTFVNGQKIERQAIYAGDIIKLGDCMFTFGRQTTPMPEPFPTLVHGMGREFSSTSMEDLLREGRNTGALRVKTAEVEKRTNDKLQILLRVSQILSSPGDIDVLLRKILELVFQILDVDRAAVLLVDPTTGRLVPRVVKSNEPEEEGGKHIFSQHIVDYVRTNSVAALFSDATSDPRLGAASSVLYQSIRASMCAPLKAKDEVIGVLYVDNLSVPDRFSEEDLEFLAAFANQAAIAIENSVLSKRIEEGAVLRNTLFRFFPPNAIKKIMATNDLSFGAMETEVTVLFADISNYTEMSSEMQPKAIVALLNEYFPVMAGVVFRHEGTLEKYIGDALMAIWGAPFQHAADADRAVMAAVEMNHALRELNRSLADKGGRQIQIHVGLNTGRVAVGNIGSEQYIQYAAIGDATNVAARVCSVAQAREVLISESTYEKLTDKSLPVEKLPPVMVKGKDRPLTLYRVRWDGIEPRGILSIRQ